MVIYHNCLPGLFSVNADLTSEIENEAAKNYMKECKSQKPYSTGKPPPIDGKSTSWMNSGFTSPEPLITNLASIDYLEILKEYLQSKLEVLKIWSLHCMNTARIFR